MLDDAAVAGPTGREAVGLGLKRYQVGSQGREVSQALVHVDHLAVQHRQHVGTGTLAALLERADLGYLRQGQTEALGGLHERQAPHVVLAGFAYYARIMAQVGLPYKAQAGTEFVRVNGNLTVSFTAPSAVGLPYGMIPRLLLCWLSTEAVTSKSRELALGHTLSEFLDQLQLGRRGRAQGDITRLRKQMTSLFGSTATAIYSLPGETGIRPIPVAEEVFLWWDPLRPTAPVFWNSTILLSEPLFRAIVERPIPVSLPVLQKLRQAPMALDLYVWLSHRLFYLKAPTTIPVELLQAQFGGAATASLRQFRAQLKGNLAKVVAAWPDLKAEVSQEGLLLRPSPLLIHRDQR